MHRTWGSSWIGFSILQLLMTTGTIPRTKAPPFPPWVFWFIALAWITGTIAVTAKNLALTLTLGTLYLGPIFAALVNLLGSSPGMG